MKKYKVRLNCISFVDVVVLAKNKADAKDEALRIQGCTCRNLGYELGEFLPVDPEDVPEN